jgi:NAD(P)-dependent dehydrogenase (short-subunit alcohol dehydrogenase family)
MAASEKKVIIITGASSGIGKETALTLVREGHVVYGAARRVEQMRDIVDAGGHAMELDVTDEAKVRGVVARILDETGRIDVLINNAGFGVFGAIEDTSLDDARRQFEVNLFGVAAVTKAALPTMRAQESGRIINVTSMGGKIYTPLGAWYHASKFALEGWSDCLRLEVSQFGIDVVIVEPGAIATEFGAVLMQPMVERSGRGAYGPMARSIARATKATGEKGGASPSSVVASTISEAIRGPRPKTRYVVGKYARPLLLMRWVLSDRAFDGIVGSEFKRTNRTPPVHMQRLRTERF